MRKFKVTLYIKCKHTYQEVIEAKNEREAVKLSERNAYKSLGIIDSDIFDDEVYCEEV